MQKRAIIVHCWDGYPDYCWYPTVKAELEKEGFEVQVPAMPETNAPKLNLWLPVLKEIAGTPGEDLFLIGHSAGCVTILRYLEQLPVGVKIGGVVLVAGFTDDLGYDELKNFFATPVPLASIREKAKGFVAIHSDNDPFVDLKYGEIFKKELGAEVIVKHNMKHFSVPRDNEESCTSLPDVTQAVLTLAK